MTPDTPSPTTPRGMPLAGPPLTGRPLTGPMPWFHGAVAAAAILGVLAGHFFQPQAALVLVPVAWFLRVLRALAPWLSLVALSHVLATANLHKRDVTRLASLLTVNTLVAALIGLLVGNLIQPGAWLHHGQPLRPVQAHSLASWLAFLQRVVSRPTQTLVDYYATVTVVVAVALGLFLRRLRRLRRQDERSARHERSTPHERSARGVWRAVDAAHRAALAYLPMVVQGMVMTMPLVVCGVVTGNVAEHGLRVFIALGALVAAVLLGLGLQVSYYLLRLRFGSAEALGQLWNGGGHGLATAFATASSTIALPVAYSEITEYGHVSEASAGLGLLVGSNFSKDGTMVYLAIAGLFAVQAGGQFPGFSLQVQLLIALGSFLARAITPGVPGAGFVTMVVVFNAVGIPLNYTPLLLTVDWLLDRCRSATNVLGCMSVSYLLDAQQARQSGPTPCLPAPAAEGAGWMGKARERA